MIEIIYGKIVILRPATPMDRKPIFDWLTNSDLTNQMMGPPAYPDSKIPVWAEFIEDYKEYFFDGSQPLSGRCFVIEVNSEPIGQINHDKIYPPDNSTELDIWLKSSRYTGKGYGTDAIVTLCDFLTRTLGCRKFIISPSKRNLNAIKAYKKAGFVETDDKVDESMADYTDAVVMKKYAT
jgi:RimJ/RimL family protein N-acetyltransferase